MALRWPRWWARAARSTEEWCHTMLVEAPLLVRGLGLDVWLGLDVGLGVDMGAGDGRIDAGHSPHQGRGEPPGLRNS